MTPFTFDWIQSESTKRQNKQNPDGRTRRRTEMVAVKRNSWMKTNDYRERKRRLTCGHCVHIQSWWGSEKMKKHCLEGEHRSSSFLSRSLCSSPTHSAKLSCCSPLMIKIPTFFLPISCTEGKCFHFITCQIENRWWLWYDCLYTTHWNTFQSIILVPTSHVIEDCHFIIGLAQLVYLS